MVGMLILVQLHNWGSRLSVFIRGTIKNICAVGKTEGKGKVSDNEGIRGAHLWFDSYSTRDKGR